MCFPSVLRDIQKLRFLKIVPHTIYLWEIETEELEVSDMSSKIQKPPPSRFYLSYFRSFIMSEPITKFRLLIGHS